MSQAEADERIISKLQGIDWQAKTKDVDFYKFKVVHPVVVETQCSYGLGNESCTSYSNCKLSHNLINN